MDLKARLAEEKALLEKAKAALTEDDRAEIALREEIALVQMQREQEELAKLEIDLERRLDVARQSLGDSLKVAGVIARGYSDSFVVMRNGKAHATWTQSMAKAQQNKNADRDDINRKYAMAVVYDWNGIIDFDSNAVSTHKLRAYLTENPGLITPITNAAAELAGVFAEERKS